MTPNLHEAPRPSPLPRSGGGLGRGSGTSAPPRRHCEERGDAAIQSRPSPPGLLRSARNDGGEHRKASIPVAEPPSDLASRGWVLPLAGEGRARRLSPLHAASRAVPSGWTARRAARRGRRRKSGWAAVARHGCGRPSRTGRAQPVDAPALVVDEAHFFARRGDGGKMPVKPGEIGAEPSGLRARGPAKAGEKNAVTGGSCEK